MKSDSIDGAVARMVEGSTRTSPTDVLGLLNLMCELLRAQAARFHVADYSLRSLQRIDASGRSGDAQTIAGTVIGRAFTSGEIQVLGSDPTVVLVPLVDGASRIGVCDRPRHVCGADVGGRDQQSPELAPRGKGLDVSLAKNTTHRSSDEPPVNPTGTSR